MALKEKISALHLNQQLSHAYLLEKADVNVAVWMAQLVYCHSNNACGECRSCRRIGERNHPDVHIIEPDGQAIKIDQIRELKREAAMKSVEGGRKVYIIAGADKLNVQAANALLKFIEEPIQDSLVILTADKRDVLLPTILSRVQVFRNQETSTLEAAAKAKGIELDHLGILCEIAKSTEELEEIGPSADKIVELVKDTFNYNSALALLSVQTEWAETITDKKLQLLSINLIQSFVKAAWNQKKRQAHNWGDSVKQYSLTEIIEMQKAADELRSGFYSNQHYLLGMEKFFLSVSK